MKKKATLELVEHRQQADDPRSFSVVAMRDTVEWKIGQLLALKDVQEIISFRPDVTVSIKPATKI